MIFTFEKRKKLNKALRQSLPGYRYEEEKAGVPRMRINRIPAGAEPADNTYGLRLMAYEYWQRHRQPLPVFIVIGSGQEQWVEVNYFDYDSPQALQTAGRYVGEHRLYVLPIAAE